MSVSSLIRAAVSLSVKSQELSPQPCNRLAACVPEAAKRSCGPIVPLDPPIHTLIEEVRFALDSPVEGSGFEPSVPLPRLSSIRAVRAEIIGRSTDVFRRDREFDVSAFQGRLSTSSQSRCSTDPGLIAGTWHRPLFLRGTDGSNPVPSSGESGANLIFGGGSPRWRLYRAEGHLQALLHDTGELRDRGRAAG